MILAPCTCLTLVWLLVLLLVDSTQSRNGQPIDSHKNISNHPHGNKTEAKQVKKSTKGSQDPRTKRSPQFNPGFNGLGRPPQIGLGQLGLSLNPRLPALGLQGTPAFGQYRSIIPQTNPLIANNAGYRLPYNYQLARLLSTINLLRARSDIASAVNPAAAAAGLGLYKPKRRKYNSIPIKPNELGGNALSLLLGANSLNSQSENDEDEDEDSENNGFCSTNPCHNGGKCKNHLFGFKCACVNGYTGKRCAGRNPCHPNPCEYDGECTVSGTSFECSCPPGRKGEKCEVEDRCHPTPCMNGGTCTELSDGHTCTCVHGYRGQNCEVRSGSCSTNPCQNNGQCLETPSGFDCICKPGYSGTICSASQNKCLMNPCQNGGKCFQTLSGTGFQCDCLSGYKGDICEDMSPCHPGTCHNGGTCYEADSGFKCICRQGFGGRNCDVHHSCQIDTCKNGARCIEHENGFKCVCSSGYRGLYCEEADRCKPNPCLHDGECIETENNYKCKCQNRFKGAHCEDMDLCSSNPCKNGGQCFSYDGGFKCMCQNGYNGDTCQVKNSCEPNPCHNDGECSQDGDKSKCSCRRGYSGDHCELVDSCLSNPCQNGGKCSSVADGFTCSCPPEYKGKYCHEKEPCHPDPCANNGKCLSTPDGFICRCSLGFKGETCSEEDECQPNPCQNDGRCIGRYIGGGFDCACSAGFRGTTCKEKDPCHPNPCNNNGFCNEIGGGITCNCSQGFKGSTCSELDKCRPNPCRHGGMCTEVVGGQGFVCRCPQSYKGLTCEAKDRCHPNPCLHDGYCLEINNDLGFLCNCSSGYRGSSCQDQDPCHPNPCNAGKCLHTSDGGFACNCDIGFKGSHCQDKDLCQPNPCQFSDKCKQTSGDSYQCVKNVCDPNPCLHGGSCIEVNDDDYQCACSNEYKGKNCDVLAETGDSRHKVPDKVPEKVPENKSVPSDNDFCHPNPCKNDGICTSHETGFNCHCNSDYTGPRCEAKKDVALKPKENDYCTPSPCKNGGVCVEEDQGYRCVCKSGFKGFHCQLDPCQSNPCNDNGKCIRDGKSDTGYRCRCLHGFVGKNCDENYCLPNPCSNNGVCVSIPDKGYQCKCRDGFNGARCERSPCSPNPCKNGGSCLVFYTVYLCKCPKEFRGTQCEASLANRPAAQVIAAQEVTATRKAETSRPRPAIHALPSSQIVNKTSGCKPDRCKNSAVCLDTIDGGYECFCRGDFSGSKCEDIGEYTYSSAPKFFPGKGEECTHCDRYAHCVGGHCICKNGYVGDGLDCWEETLEDREWTCEVNPCQNGGTCKPGISKCVCRLGYIGKYCEEECTPSIHLSFDKVSASTLLDDSGDSNNAMIMNGAQIAPHSGKCGNAVNLLGGDIFMDGLHFKHIPRKGITISVWIKLETKLGVQSIFDTVGSHSIHKDGQYHLEVDNGRVRWFHRDENRQTIFSVLSRPAVSEGRWTQVTVTYSANKQRARVFVDGDMITEEGGHGLLSQDWAGKVGIGKHRHIFGNRLLRGMVDEFYIFPGELPRLEILVLMRHCKVYFSNFKKKKQKDAKKVPQLSFTPNAPVVNSYVKPYTPPIGGTPLTPSNQEANKDKVGNNLEEILESFDEDSPVAPQRSTLSNPGNQIQKQQRPWPNQKPYQGNTQPNRYLPNRYLPNRYLPNRYHGVVPAQTQQFLFDRGRKIPQMQAGTMQDALQRPVGKQTIFNKPQAGNPAISNLNKGYRFGQYGSQRNSAMVRMQNPLSYSINPPRRVPHGSASSTPQMRGPLTYMNGMFAPARPVPDTNFAVASTKTRIPVNQMSAYARRRQYLSYNPPSRTMKTATGVLPSWLNSATPNINRTPLRSSVFGKTNYPQRGWYRSSQTVPQKSMQPLNARGSTNYFAYNRRYPYLRPQPAALSRPAQYQGAPSPYKVVYKNYDRNFDGNHGNHATDKPTPSFYDNTHVQGNPRTMDNRKNTGLDKNSLTGPQPYLRGNNHNPKYTTNLQESLNSMKQSGLLRKVDPSKYLAFKLTPQFTSDPDEMYSNALAQLNSQLRQLMDDHTVDFKPEQLQFVMGLLQKGLDQMEQSVEGKQGKSITGKDRIPYTQQRQGLQYIQGNPTQRRDEILRPVQNSKTVYKLTYPDKRQTKYSNIDERLNNPYDSNNVHEYGRPTMTADFRRYSNTLTRILRRRKNDVNRIVTFVKRELKKQREKVKRSYELKVKNRNTGHFK